jgi:hypothetical protein
MYPQTTDNSSRSQSGNIPLFPYGEKGTRLWHPTYGFTNSSWSHCGFSASASMSGARQSQRRPSEASQADPAPTQALQSAEALHRTHLQTSLPSWPNPNTDTGDEPLLSSFELTSDSLWSHLPSCRAKFERAAERRSRLRCRVAQGLGHRNAMESASSHWRLSAREGLIRPSMETLRHLILLDLRRPHLATQHVCCVRQHRRAHVGRLRVR